MNMKKNMLCLIVAAVAVFALLVLPLLSYSERFISVKVGILSSSEMLEFGVFDDFFSIAWVLALVAGAGAIYGAYKKDKQITFIASAVAAGLMLLSMITLPEKWEEFSFGIGFWLSLLGFAATAVMVKVFEKEWDEQ